MDIMPTVSDDCSCVCRINRDRNLLRNDTHPVVTSSSSKSWLELEDLMAVNGVAMGTLSQQDPELWVLSATETHVGQMYSRQGRFRDSLDSLLTACNIKTAAPQVDLKTLCWTEDNIAVNY